MDQTQMEGVEKFLAAKRIFFEDELKKICAAPHMDTPPRLWEAMSYSLLAGGKRLRPILCMTVAEKCGADPSAALPLAVAYEMMHTATLIFDDLPCMDNDDLRRGKPTSHKKFGEALALNAGNALQSLAFEYVLTRLTVDPAKAVRALAVFAEAAGPHGVFGGQVLDMALGGAGEGPAFVRQVARLKTGALLKGAVVSGAILGGVDVEKERRYAEYGSHLGTAFQVVDDILDETSDAATLGKTPGKDKEQNKNTFVAAFGMDGAKKLAESESAMAAAVLSPLFPAGDVLIDLAAYLVARRF